MKPSKKNQQNDRFALNASIEADQKPFDIISFSVTIKKNLDYKVHYFTYLII